MRRILKTKWVKPIEQQSKENQSGDPAPLPSRTYLKVTTTGSEPREHGEEQPAGGGEI